MELQTYKTPRRIGCGKDGVVFQISRDLVAKIGFGERVTFHESEIAERAHQEGISIPVPYGVHLITFPHTENPNPYAGKTINGFVMEKLIGKNGFQLCGPEEVNEAYVLLNMAIKKAVLKGFNPIDSRYPRNYIFTPDREIKLIDFTSWSHRDIPSILRNREN